MDSFSTKIVFHLLMMCGASVLASNVTTCSCYGFYNQNSTWDESAGNCSRYGGHLVTMETKGEWKFIDSEIQNRSTFKNEWYIGLKNETGVFKWINNKNLTLEKWQPDFQPSGDGKCVVMAKNYPISTKGLWNDLACTNRRGFICEYNQGNNNCTSSKTFPTNCTWQNPSTPTESTTPTTVCISDPGRFSLVYVVIILGILLAGGIGCYIYIFYCKNRTTGLSRRCKENGSSEYKASTSLQIEESAVPLQTREPTTDTVLEDDHNKASDTTTIQTNTERETLSEPQEPAQDTVDDSETKDYTLPTDPSSASTYASLYSTINYEQKKPEENEDIAPPKMPSPYHKVTSSAHEPVVYATVDKCKKTKGKDSHVEVVYARVDKSRKSNVFKDDA